MEALTMKKLFCSFLVLTIALACFFSAGAEDSYLPSINDLLQAGLTDGRFEVGDDLDAYSVFNGELSALEDDFIFLILQRDAPLKEFTAETVYPPFSDSDGFPDDYEGVDIGTGRLWLRADLMQKVPPAFIAPSLEDANYLIIADNIYLLGGSLCVTNFSGGGNEEMPEFETVEEMAEYLQTHQKEVESMTYYPKFSAYTIIALYETKTKNVSFINANYIPATRFARNPEASDQWSDMSLLLSLLSALDEGEGVDTGAADSLLESMDFVPDDKKSLWDSCIRAGEYATAAFNVTDYFWSMAGDLRDLDPSESNRSNYDLIIESKNTALLQWFVSFCDYAGFDRSISSIESSGEYIASLDEEWTEASLQEFLSVFGN